MKHQNHASQNMINSIIPYLILFVNNYKELKCFILLARISRKKQKKLLRF